MKTVPIGRDQHARRGERRKLGAVAEDRGDLAAAPAHRGKRHGEQRAPQNAVQRDLDRRDAREHRPVERHETPKEIGPAGIEQTKRLVGMIVNSVFHAGSLGITSKLVMARECGPPR